MTRCAPQRGTTGSRGRVKDLAARIAAGGGDQIRPRVVVPDARPFHIVRGDNVFGRGRQHHAKAPPLARQCGGGLGL